MVNQPQQKYSVAQKEIQCLSLRINLTSPLFFNLVHIFTSGMVNPSCEVNSTELHRQTLQVQIESVYDCCVRMAEIAVLGLRQSKSHFYHIDNKVRADICHEQHELYSWRKLSCGEILGNVEEMLGNFEIFREILENFATIYALSCGEKLSPKVHLWRKNNKYEI